MTRWIVIAVALAAGFWLLSYDQRTDDTGVEAALIVAISLALTLAAPRVWLAVALAIGLPIVGWGLAHGNGPAFIALVFALAGALIGYAMRRNALTPRA